ncbi:MAG: membrane protein insertion efficiency factor YidD, partial [Deltaproteobacteria bacterium]|nr:membrane protein insertion efficiency factor YidD [Deltaproteobacteria bacterium]
MARPLSDTRKTSGTLWHSMAARIGRAAGVLLLALIRFYQAAISPYLPRACRFHPTCSHYAADAIRVHGALRGSALAARRLARCHPFHPGGHDPVPLPLNKERMMPSTVRTTLTALVLALTLLAQPTSAAAACGDEEPGRVEWTP